MQYKAHASLGARLLAYVLDSLILVTPLSITRRLLSITEVSSFTKAILFRWTLASIIIYLITVSYFIFMTKATGQTLGKMIMKIRVVSIKTDSLGWIQVIYRETVGKFLSAFLCIGYIVLIFNKDRRALHDIICDTAVLSNRQAEVPAEYQHFSAPQSQFTAAPSAPGSPSANGAADFSACRPAENTIPGYIPFPSQPYSPTDPRTVPVPPGSIPGGPVVYFAQPQQYGCPSQYAQQPQPMSPASMEGSPSADGFSDRSADQALSESTAGTAENQMSDTPESDSDNSSAETDNGTRDVESTLINTYETDSWQHTDGASATESTNNNADADTFGQ